MKYLLIGKKIGNYTNGSYNVYKKFSELYSSENVFVDHLNTNNLHLYNDYKKLIFCCHQTNLSNGLYFKLLTTLKGKYTLFTRDFSNNILNTATNGFSVYKQHKNLVNFIPIISLPQTICSNSSIDCDVELNYSYPTYGFYNRSMTLQATSEILNRIVQSKSKRFNIITCGSYIDMFSKLGVNHYHTTDSDIFFTLIDNYIHIQSNYIDPVPNMLLEAFYRNKTVVSYALDSRHHLDGCDDVLSLFDYYPVLNFDAQYDKIDNRSNISILKNLSMFYVKLFKNNFNYHLDRNKYTNFKEWLESI